MTFIIKTDAQPEGHGYLMVDQRASGIPVFGGKVFFEADTYTCSHCNAVVVMNPERKRERYKCKGCSHHICDWCAGEMVAGGHCKTMAQLIEEVQLSTSKE